MAKKYGAAAISYVFTWLSGLIVYLLTKKSDKFTRFHAAQAILLGIAIVILGWIPLVGFVIAILLYIVGLFVAVNAYNRKKIELPLFGDLAKKFV